MHARLFTAPEEARSLVDDIHAKFPPGQFGRVSFGENAHPVTVNHKVAAIDGNITRELAVGGVVLRSMGVGFRVTEIVDRNDLDFVGAARLVKRAHDVPADAAIAIDCNLNCHGLTPNRF
jgi:hypothetical protein